MKNIKLISASAGSGKTYRLMEILHEALTVKGITPDQVIAMTFTKDAALEISERAREKLVEKGLIDLSLQIAAAKIGTIHSVCGLLLEMFAFDEGVSPRQNVMSEEEGHALFETCFNEYLDETKFMELVQNGRKFDLNDKDIRSLIKNLSTEMRSQNLSQSDQQESLKKTLSLFKEIFPAAVDGKAMDARLQMALSNWDTSGLVPSQQKNSIGPFQYLKTICHEGVDKLTWQDWLELTSIAPAAKERQIYAPVQEAAADFHAHGGYQTSYLELITKIYDLAFNIKNFYQQKKITLGIIDFVDLELRFLNLLDQPTVRSRIKEQFRLIMIDEFQDTSPIQLAIFLKLSKLVENMIWVGDPKQSIFGFRGADPILMKSILSRMPKENIDYLDTSYRSKAELVNKLSDAFVTSFAEDGYTEKEVRLKPDAKKQTKFTYHGPVMELWPMSGNLEVIYATVADQIQALLQSDPKLKPSDIGVLCPRNDQCQSIATELNRLGIKSSFTDANPASTEEVQLLLCIYKSVCSYDNRLHESEILSILAGELTIKDASSAHPWSELIELKRTQKSILTPSKLIDDILIEGKYLDFIERFEQAERRIKNLKLMQSLSREYESFCFKTTMPCSLTGFIDYLGGMDPDRRFDSEKGKSRNDQLIDLKTFHGSKGLQWKITLVYGLDGSIEPRKPLFGKMVNFDKKTFDPENCLQNRYVIQLFWPFGLKDARPALQSLMQVHPLYIEKALEQRQEKKRLLYVALTRAEESLIIPFKSNSKSRGFLDLVPGLQMPPESSRELEKQEAGNIMNKIHQEQKAIKFDPRPLYVNPSLFEEVESSTAPVTKDFIQYAEPIKVTKAFIQDSADFGQFLHAFIAGDNVHAPISERILFLTDCGKRWGYETKDLQDLILQQNSLFFRELDKKIKGDFIPEFPLELQWGEDQFMRGAIDLLILPTDPNGEILIVDHKTSQIEAKDINWKATSHAIQLGLYKKAIESLYPGRKVKTLLHFPLAGLLFEVVI
jgi:ATP-dependent helicase/nuclease subunit A